MGRRAFMAGSLSKVVGAPRRRAPIDGVSVGPQNGSREREFLVVSRAHAANRRITKRSSFGG